MRKGVQKIYSEVADTYELVNHVLTFGFDVYWRKKAASLAVKAGGLNLLDVCCGTGEMAVSLAKRAKQEARVYAVDFSLPMLKKIKEKRHGSRIFVSLADASHLPFPDESVDLIILSFAARNLNVRREVFQAHCNEFRRVLKSGGQFMNLETSQPSSKLIRRLFHFYTRWVVKPVGFFFSGSRSGYSYLAHTIPRFYSAEELSEILIETGFDRVDTHTYLAGIAAIHRAVKG
jgi:demethylmenaquinone methyltransferase/2-methoxy-6-polyprenyl-1,4-benzoquinol methylase